MTFIMPQIVHVRCQIILPVILQHAAQVHTVVAGEQHRCPQLHHQPREAGAVQLVLLQISGVAVSVDRQPPYAARQVKHVILPALHVTRGEEGLVVVRQGKLR